VYHNGAVPQKESSMDFDFGPVETLDKVPEQFRSIYGTEAKDGKFLPVEAHKGVIEAFTGMAKAIKAERKSKVDLTPLQDYGKTPAEIAESFATKVKGLEEQLAAGAKIDPVKLKGEFQQAHQAELTKHKNRAEALQAELYRVKVEQAVTAAVVEAKGDPDLLIPHIVKRVKITEDGGKFDVAVLDDAGDKRFNGVTGLPMTIKDLVVEMKADKKWGRGFDADAPAGGGMPPGGPRRPRPAGAPLSSVDKIAAGLRNLPTTSRSLT